MAYSSNKNNTPLSLSEIQKNSTEQILTNKDVSLNYSYSMFDPTDTRKIRFQDVIRTNPLSTISSKIISKTFGRPEDYIELHIYSTNDKLLESFYNFTDYTIPEEIEDSGITNELIFDPETILKSLGYTTGKYKIKFNILRNKIFDDPNKRILTLPFNIKDLSSSRREIKSTTTTSNEILDSSVYNFIAEINSSSYFKDFTLNLGQDILIPCINILLNKEPLSHEVFIKTLNKLPSIVNKNSTFKVVEEIVDPFYLDVDLGEGELIDDSIELMGPNFNIDISINNSI